jgi:cytochrome c nitrite reductase small subunit
VFGKFLSVIMPPQPWRIPVIVALGIATGLGLLVFRISNAVSYLSNRPETCMNCHVMAPQFATWQRGSHTRVATCNDCHVPQDNFVRTYAFKARDGSRHAYMFTLRLEPQVIRVHEAGMEVIQENCIRCHREQLQWVSARTTTLARARHGQGKLCWECHRDTPHGRVNSLASVPYARVPILSPVTPDWLERMIEE